MNFNFTVEKDGFHGQLFPAEQNRCPGKCLILFGGSDGNFQETRRLARFYSEKGLDILALAFWNEEGLPKRFDRVPVESIERAARHLLSQGYEKAGVWGISMGGELALLAGSLMPELLSCVVAVNPMDMTTQGFSYEGGLHMLETSAFSWRGEGFPYVGLELRTGRLVKESLKHLELSMRHVYDEGIAAGVPEEAWIRVENIGGPVLLLSAHEDRMWGSLEACERVKTRLREKGFSHPVRHLDYQYTSHMLYPLKTADRFAFAMERRHPGKCWQTKLRSAEDTMAFLREVW